MPRHEIERQAEEIEFRIIRGECNIWKR